MAMNPLEKMLAEARSQDGLEELVSALEEEQTALGDAPTDEDCAEAIQRALSSVLQNAVDAVDGEGDEDTEESAAFMAEAVAVVEEALDDQELHYSSRALRSDLTIFQLDCRVNGVNLRMNVYVEDDPRNCRIKAVLPFTADPLYAYPLCRALITANYPKRYGCFQYDEKDGEICYEYSYPITHGIVKSDFLRMFRVVISSAVDNDAYPIIKKYSVGKFKNAEKEEILSKINDMVEDMTE